MSADVDLTNLLRHVAAQELAAPGDLLDAAALAQNLRDSGERSFDLIAVGDIMLGGRARRAILAHGPSYPFAAVKPLLSLSPIILGNLEGPLAANATRKRRNFSYRVDPELALAMADAGINVVTLANNHLVDCGRRGVTETIESVEAAGVACIGAGRDREQAHEPVILEHGGLRLGLLGYYWNRRCAATDSLPGSAMDPPEALASDIAALRRRADRVVITFHWGIPYERQPLDADRQKARLAIDLGADAVIGHHPHVVQPFEIHRGKPIFYSVGNFTFGSGNSRGEGLLLGFRFERGTTTVAVFPLYVKNRDPRVDYQPKVLRGNGARRVLENLASASGADGGRLAIEGFRGVLELPYESTPRGSS